MAVYKCKMCSGELDVNEGVTVIECDYCGTKQTVPKAKDENLQGLFNRANTLRKKSDFDKSEQIYEKILQIDSTQAEAYWGLILCKYGIEYVEDPQTFKRIPTCHRTSYDSIIADDDYKSAINNADAVQRSIYESEAKEIDRIQKEIISLSQKEEPYDVFICYKETDETGKRTQDSVIANDIYYQLTKEGFKVFYAAITLEDKLGSAYEPCIFAALNSSKVMLAVGTKPEYFNAVWVRNEWSRFLRMMKKNRNKILIPCYKDMDAYELPEEFAHLQAQDMSKIGFINDVIRGVEKLIRKNDTPPAVTTTVQQTMVASSDVDISPLLERMFIFLEDGDWESADEYAEKVLDRDPKNALAYLGKLMSDLDVKKREGLANVSGSFDNLPEYEKIRRFGDEALCQEIEEYNRIVTERYNDNLYSDALQKMNSNNLSKCIEALNIFESIGEWKDSVKQIENCKIKIDKLREKEENKKRAREQSVSLQKKIDSLMEDKKTYKEAIDYLVLERTRPANLAAAAIIEMMLGGLGLVMGIVMLSSGETTGMYMILGSVFLFLLGKFLLRKYPSEKVIAENYRLKAEHLREIEKIDEEIKKLNRQLSDISKNSN